MNYRCPLCATPLLLNNRTWCCTNKHSFDVAKEGYVNLLPVQNKKSKDPGDNGDMIQARRRFLEQGYYRQFADQFIKALENTHGALLDIGCGEGYYSALIAAHHSALAIHGMDISKPAVKSCAKKYRDAHYCVASAFDLPYFDEQFAAALSVFSPIDLNEAARILKPNGLFIFAGPGATHLKELAAQIYTEVLAHEGNKKHPVPASLTLIEQRHHQQEVEISGAHLSDLLLMTPYYWSCSEEKKAQIASLDKLRVSLDFEIHIYQKMAE